MLQYRDPTALTSYPRHVITGEVFDLEAPGIRAPRPSRGRNISKAIGVSKIKPNCAGKRQKEAYLAQFQNEPESAVATGWGKR